jgi:hypothetical protein
MKLLIWYLSVVAVAQALASWPLAGARLAMTSFGPLRIGMSEASIKRIIQRELPEEPSGADKCCAQLYVREDPGIVLMFERTTLTRIDVGDAHHFTLRGLRVGDSERRARELYSGEYEDSAHKYVDDGHYLTVRSANKRYALVIETDGHFVTRLRAGTVPAVEYVEGCN